MFCRASQVYTLEQQHRLGASLGIYCSWPCSRFLITAARGSAYFRAYLGRRDLSCKIPSKIPLSIPLHHLQSNIFRQNHLLSVCAVCARGPPFFLPWC